MFGRKIRSNLPMVQKILRESVVLKQKDAKKQKQKCQFDKKAVELPPLKVGDYVRLRESKKGVVKSQIEATPGSYVVEVPDKASYRRNRKDILKTEENFDFQDLEAEICDSDIKLDNEKTGIQNENNVLRRSERIRTKPNRLVEEM